MNPMQIMQLIRQGGNPQQAIMNMLQTSAPQNPMMANLFSLAQGGNGAQIEQIARNMCQSRGRDFDQEFGNFKHMLGIK